MSDLKDFAAIILTHGRPKNVVTYETLRKCGYTGRIVILIDDTDKTKNSYIEEFGDEVFIFDKAKIKKESDSGNNFNDLRSTIYPRNAMFEVAKQLNIKYFIQLDDDYVMFRHRFDNNLEWCCTNYMRHLDKVFASMLRFHIKSGTTSVCMFQGGDFIGGSGNIYGKNIKTKRKGMNTFICSYDRPFKFFGQMNEDVNTVIRLGSTGSLFLSINQIFVDQKQTQKNSGGMTEIYLDSGTYIKSFYSVMYHPSSAKIGVIKDRADSRIHHKINWNRTVPKILRESVKKKAGVK